jgi:hypothetical protein
MAESSLLRETDEEGVHCRSIAQVAYQGERSFMNTLQTTGTSAASMARVVAVEWHVDPPALIPVREQCGVGDHSTLKLVRYVKLALGVFNHRPSSGTNRLHRNHRVRAMGR